ncbi:MAG: hypothetical protein M1828_001739 [Chrysothrix sp. TS-e1954]|nr:MAG: hypothetical protein M1828_001739 [Chrysothrix sp. TS-e1954]
MTIPESHVDVLIIGAGPAGLMAATWMSRLGINTRIVDRRGTKVFNGQADGLQCRSLEILDSFGFADRVWKESHHLLEFTMWNSDETGAIRRSDRIPVTIPNISRFQQVVLHQGRIERFFLDHIQKHSDSTILVERAVLPVQLDLDRSLVSDAKTYPIRVQLRHLTNDEATPEQNASRVPDGLFRSSLAEDDTDGLIRRARDEKEQGREEVVRSKYLIGCDGAHSWTRHQLGIELEGQSTDFIWGVLDIIPITNFPDIRTSCAIHSACAGSLMIVPREQQLVRLYTQLTEVQPDATGRADRSKISPEIILKAAQKIIAPYKLDYQHCDWWTAYQVGQRVGTKFSAFDRVFLAGDAVHTHSPKAGQGMNVSLQDCYNLAWKIGLVVTGKAMPTILETYESERRPIARELIAFDHHYSRLFSSTLTRGPTDNRGISETALKDAFEKGNLFASGIAVDYGASLLIAKCSLPHDQATKDKQIISKQGLATGLPTGMRFGSTKVLNQSDARPWHFAEKLNSDGRFRVVLFAGCIVDKAQHARVKAFCHHLQLVVRKYTPATLRINQVIQVLTIHSAPRCSVDIFDFPELLRPFDESLGWEYNQIFVDDESYHEGHGEAYEYYGVDSQSGCAVIVRPDQHVAYIGSLEDTEDIARYFEAFMVPTNQISSSSLDTATQINGIALGRKC